jgi:PleD family two-component response regulator
VVSAILHRDFTESKDRVRVTVSGPAFLYGPPEALISRSWLARGAEDSQVPRRHAFHFATVTVPEVLNSFLAGRASQSCPQNTDREELFVTEMMSRQDSERMSLLLAMAPEEPGFRGILSYLESLGIELAVVSDCRGVRRQLRATNPSVVITGVTLCDGNWCDLLSFVVESGVGASVIVVSSEIDERLRSEVVSRGAYDLISSPLSPPQLRRCIEEAHYFRKETLSRKIQRTNAAV